MPAMPRYTRSKGKTREQRGTSHHHADQRIERECGRAHGRVQEVMYKFSDEVQDLVDDAALVKFLDDHEVFSHGYGVKPYERLVYIGAIVAELRRDKLIIDGLSGGFYLASRAKEYQRGAAQRAMAAAQHQTQTDSKPDIDAPGFSWKAWSQELKAAS